MQRSTMNTQLAGDAILFAKAQGAANAAAAADASNNNTNKPNASAAFSNRTASTGATTLNTRLNVAFSASQRRMNYTTANYSQSTKDGPEWHQQRAELYGRQEEHEMLAQLRASRKRTRPQAAAVTATASLEESLRISEQISVLLVKGVAGSGRTSLIQKQPWTQEGWLFASGEFVQHRRGQSHGSNHNRSNISSDQQHPFSGWIDVFTSLTRAWVKSRHKEQDDMALQSLHKMLEQHKEHLKAVLPKVYQIGGYQKGGSQTKGALLGVTSAQESVENSSTGTLHSDEDGRPKNTLSRSFRRRKKRGSLRMSISMKSEGTNSSSGIDLSSSDLQNSSSTKTRTKGIFKNTSTLTNSLDDSMAAFTVDSGKVGIPEDNLESIQTAMVHLLSFLVSQQPTAVLLDDIDWIDVASMQLLQSILSLNDNNQASNSNSNLLLILTVRDFKLDLTSSLQQFLRDLQYNATTNPDESPEFHQLIVEDLNLEAVYELTTAVTLHRSNQAHHFHHHQHHNSSIDFLHHNGSINFEHHNNSSNLSMDNSEDNDELYKFAQVLYSKTHGNPASLWEMLQRLRQDKFLEFSFERLRWEWGSLASLESLAYLSENVADLVISSFAHLENDTQVVLRVASCLGRFIPLDVMVQYFRKNGAGDEEENTPGRALIWSPTLKNTKHQNLDAILKEALLLEILSQYTRVPSEDTAPDAGGNGLWRPHYGSHIWSHDKLQEAAYESIPESLRPGLHCQLGTIVWKMSTRRRHEEDWMVYLAADQLCRCSQMTNDNDFSTMRGIMDGVQAAKLCMAAAKLSISKGALFPAVEMLQTGLRYLKHAFHQNDQDAWDCHYALHLEMSSFLAETTCRVGLHDVSIKAAEDVLGHARTLEDKFRAECAALECTTAGSTRDYVLAIKQSISILKEYGEKVPTKFTTEQLLKSCEKLQSKAEFTNLSTLAMMTNGTSRKCVKLLVTYAANYLWKSQDNWKLGWWCAIRAVNITMEKGYCEDSALAVSIIGWHLRRNGQYKKAAEYADLSTSLLARFPERVGSQHAIVKFGAVAAVYSATRPFNLNLEMFLDAYRIGLRTGATEEAFEAITAYAYSYLNVGMPLGSLRVDLVSFGKEAEQLGMPQTTQAIFRIFRQTILNLQTEMADPTFLNGDAFDQFLALRKADGAGRLMTSVDISTFQLLLSVIYNDWSKAEDMIHSIDMSRKDGFICRNHLRTSYIGVASIIIGRKKGKKKFRTLGKKVLSTFHDDAKLGAVNSHAVMLMLEALESPSKESYEKAIKGSARLGVTQQEAILCEQAARFFIDQGDEYWSEFYLSRALACYRDWGAPGKCESLRRELPDYLPKETASEFLRESSQQVDPNGRTRYSSEYFSGYKEATFTSFRRLTVNVAGPAATAENRQEALL